VSELENRLYAAWNSYDQYEVRQLPQLSDLHTSKHSPLPKTFTPQNSNVLCASFSLQVAVPLSRVADCLAAVQQIQH
jgi:hypothetical protein